MAAVVSHVRVAETFRHFEGVAPGVELEVSIEPTNVIEAGIFDGKFDVGTIPTHRKSSGLEYIDLYAEPMFLFCGSAHPLFDRPSQRITATEIRKYKYAGLGFHSPNLVVGNKLKLSRAAEVHDQEAVVLLILSGCYIGFLPDHFAQPLLSKTKCVPLGRRSSAIEVFCRDYAPPASGHTQDV